MADFQAGPRGRHRLRDRDRRARQGRRRAALPRRRHRGPRRSRLVRRRLGPAGRRQASSPACRPPSRSRCRCTPATSGSTCRARVAMLAPSWGLGQLLDISDEQARDDLARASVMALSFVAQSARGLGLPTVPQKRGRRGHDHRRAVHDPLAGRARPRARQGRRRLLRLRRRARHERLDVHRPRRRRPPAPTSPPASPSAVGALSGPLHGGAPTPGADDARRGRAQRRRRRATSRACSTATSG